MSEEIILGTVNIGALVKAFGVFDGFRKNLDSDQEIAGAIQAFEFTFEQTWKTIKKVLQKKGISCGSPRDTFRAAAQDGLLNNPDVWFSYLDKRNLTSHTYNRETAVHITKCFEGFAQDTKNLIMMLRSQK